MPYIQTDTSEESLITATRANMADFFQYMGSIQPVESLKNEKFASWHTPVQHPWFNGVLSTAPVEEADNSFIKEAIQYFRKNNIRAFTWWMKPPLNTSDWSTALTQHGFGLDNSTPGMALDLNHLNESLQSAEGFEIRPVQDESSVRIWANVFVRGYGLPANWNESVFDLWFKFGFDFPVKSYIGYLNNIPVATSCLFYGGGAAGIYSVSTLPEARGKGIGAAITLQPLQEARKAGYRIGTLQSSDMGFNIYKRLGFKHLCQIESFYCSTQ